jgi:hypothetical protein
VIRPADTNEAVDALAAIKQIHHQPAPIFLSSPLS